MYYYQNEKAKHRLVKNICKAYEGELEIKMHNEFLQFNEKRITFFKCAKHLKSCFIKEDVLQTINYESGCLQIKITGINVVSMSTGTVVDNFQEYEFSGGLENGLTMS